MANNTLFREASVSPLLCGNCTTSHSVPITTPGAESTNNLTRARRLGPRWQAQRQLDTQRERPGALLEIPSPPTSVSEAPSQPHGLTMGGDVRPIRPAPTAAPGVTKPLQTAATPLRARKGSNRQWSISLGMAVLTVLTVLAAIAWHVGAKRTNSGAVAMGHTPTALPKNSPQILPPSGASVKSMVAAKSEAPRDQSEADDSADRTAQTRTVQEEHQLIPVPPDKNEFARPDSATNRTSGKATTYWNADAPVDMANEYLRSEGVPRGCAKAMLLLNKAAAKGNVRARNRLASLYAIGSCVPRDPIQAYRWLNAALDANPDNQWALQNRDLILRQMTAKERSQVRNTE
jgi:hypothetical protein